MVQGVMWLPDIDTKASRLYVAVADALARDIASGKLVPGQQLPTHRELAWQLKVSVSTISKAYALAERRRLIQGEVGRGTFIAPQPSDISRAEPNRAQPDLIDLSFNCPVLLPDIERAVADALQHIASAGVGGLLPYQRQWLGMPHHRAAASRWLAATADEPSPDDIVIVNGAQHGMAAVLAALAKPGDVVAIEELADPGIRFLVSNRQLSARGVALDHEGMIPESLEALCHTERVTFLICMPGLHSPTLAVMSAERRARIAEIVKRHGITVIENDVHGAFADERLPTLSSLARDQSFYVTSLSKALLPGLRIGFIVTPPGRASELIPGFAATSWMASLLPAEVVSRLIDSGVAAELMRQQREEMRRRQDIAARVLAGQRMAARPMALHVWLSLPESWRAETLVSDLRRRGVAVTPAESFAVGHGATPQAVRLSIGGATPTREELQKGLTIVAETLGSSPPPSYLVM